MKNYCFIILFISIFPFSLLLAEEGIVSKVTFLGFPEKVNKEPLIKELLNKEGVNYEKGFLPLDSGWVVRYLQDNAYLEAVAVPKVNEDNKMISIEYTVSTGPIFNFGCIEIKGASADDLAEVRKNSGIRVDEKTPITKEKRALLIDAVGKQGLKVEKKYSLNTSVNIESRTEDWIFVPKDDP